MSSFKNNLNVVKDLQIFSVTSQLMHADGQNKNEKISTIKQFRREKSRELNDSLVVDSVLRIFSVVAFSNFVCPGRAKNSHIR